jgi:iron uptake system EfeUOB component EfeO/EfeM
MGLLHHPLGEKLKMILEEISMVFEKVAKILAEYKEIDVSEIRPESTLEELGA